MSNNADNYYWRRQASVRKLSTKGFFCFLCLGGGEGGGIGGTELNRDSTSSSTGGDENEKRCWDNFKSMSLRSLRICLQIDCKNSSYGGNNLGDKDDADDGNRKEEGEIEVDLCAPCGELISKFSSLFQQLETIQMRLDDCLEEINERVPEPLLNQTQTSSVDYSEAVRKYLRRKNSNSAEDKKEGNLAVQVKLMDDLRKKIATRSLSICVGPELRVDLGRKPPDAAQHRKTVPGRLPPSNISSSAAAALQLQPQNDNRFKIQIKEEVISSDGEEDEDDDDNDNYSNNSVSCVRDLNPLPSPPASPPPPRLLPYYENDSSVEELINNNSSGANKNKNQQIPETEATTTNPKLNSNSTQKDCSTCHKMFSTPRNLRLHVQHVHMNIRNYPCDLCPKAFKKSSALKEHKDGIHFKTIYNCRNCNLECRGTGILRKHETRCSSKKKSFSSTKKKRNKIIPQQRSSPKPKKIIQSPTKTNSNSKGTISKCSVCKKGFPTVSRLKVHVRLVHLHIRKFPCDLCAMTFQKSSALEDHKDGIHFRTIYKCKICTRECRGRAIYRNHERKCEKKKKKLGVKTAPNRSGRSLRRPNLK